MWLNVSFWKFPASKLSYFVIFYEAFLYLFMEKISPDLNNSL